ncbi:MAG: hypothetical protein SVM80_02320 [Halobacteriota archaeon]|nr:hypothetical protein [Halobacteriota archaeon]
MTKHKKILNHITVKSLIEGKRDYQRHLKVQRRAERHLWILMLLALFTLIMVIPTASALSASKVEFENAPLAPGETTELWIVVKNDGSDTLQNVVLTLQQSAETQSIIGILDGSVGLGILSPRESGKARFTIYAAPDADDGIYNFDINVKYSTSTSNQTTTFTTPTTLTTFTVQVLGEPPYLVISETSDNVIAPGTTKEVSITVKNVGIETADDVFLEINPIPETEESGTTTSSDLGSLSDLLGSSISTSIPGMPSLMGSGEENPPPFVVTGSGTRFFVGDLKPGESGEISFKISADSEAKKGVYNLPVTLNRRNGRSTSEYVGVIVSSKAELNIPDIRTDPKEVVPGKSAILSVTVENTGKNDAKSVRVALMKNEYILETTSNYVGTVSPDEDDTTIFEIVVVDGAPEIIPVTFQISYQDETGHYSFVEKGDINVEPSPTEEVKSESGSSFPILGTVSVILLMSVMIFYFSKKKGLDQFMED